MKKIFLVVTLILTLVFIPNKAKAESYVAEVNGVKYATIESAMTAAEGTKNIVKLLDNVTLTQMKTINKDLTIDLNGFNIYKNSKLFEVRGATFTVVGTGRLEETTPDYSPIMVYGSKENESNYTTINIGENVTLKGWAGIFVNILKSYSTKEFKDKTAHGVIINFNGKIESVKDTANQTGHGIYVNGLIKHTENPPIINIGKNSKIYSLGIGLGAFGNAEWNVDGAEITGEQMGLGIKAGKINVKNSTVITKEEDSTPVDGYIGGMVVSGASVQIESNRSYFGEIEIKFENSKFISEKGLGYYEYIGNKKDTETKVKSVEIKNCEFDSLKDRPSMVVSDSYKTKYTKNITVEKVENGTVTVDKISALVGEKVTVSTTAKEGYEQKN